MKKSDKERLHKIISTWDELQKQIKERNITKEGLLTDTFLQWAFYFGCDAVPSVRRRAR